MSEFEVPLTRFGRRQTRGVLLGFSGPRVVALGTAVGLVGVGLPTGTVLLVLPVALVLVVASFWRWQGRPLVESAGVLAHWQARKATGQTRYLVDVDEPRPEGTMQLPGDAAALRFLTVATGPGTNAGLTGGVDGDVVMVHDPHRQTLTAVAELSYQAFVLLDGHAQARRVGKWAAVQAGQAGLERTSTIQVLESVIPDPGRGVVGWWRAHGHHAPEGSWVAEQYAELMAMYAPTASTHRTLIAVGLDMRRSARQIKRAGRGVKGAAALLATDLVQLTDSLGQAELRVERWLGESELAAVIRSAYDPAVDLPANAPGARLAVAGPKAIEEHWDHVRHDSGFSVALWVSDWPRSETVPNFMHKLIFASDVRRTLSLFLRPIPTAEALRQIRREKVDYITDLEHKAKVGQVAAESDAEEFGDVIARERALNAGHADMRYTGLLTVTAPSLEEVMEASDQIRRTATACGMETEILYGRQAQAFTATTLPLARPIPR